MKIGTFDIIIPLLEFLQDKEFHNLSETCLHLQKSMRLSIKEKNEYYQSRNKNSNIIKLHSTKFYIRVADAVHVIRKAGLIDDFDNQKGKGKFRLNENGFDFLKNDNAQMIKQTKLIFEKWKSDK